MERRSEAVFASERVNRSGAACFRWRLSGEYPSAAQACQIDGDAPWMALQGDRSSDSLCLRFDRECRGTVFFVFMFCVFLVLIGFSPLELSAALTPCANHPPNQPQPLTITPVIKFSCSRNAIPNPPLQGAAELKGLGSMAWHGCQEMPRLEQGIEESKARSDPSRLEP